MKGVTRPKKTTLPASAQIPAKNLRPPPVEYTHYLRVEQTFFYEPDASAEPVATFAAGTRVARLGEIGGMCRVVDSRGLDVYTSCEGLEPLAT